MNRSVDNNKVNRLNGKNIEKYVGVKTALVLFSFAVGGATIVRLNIQPGTVSSLVDIGIVCASTAGTWTIGELLLKKYDRWKTCKTCKYNLKRKK